MNKDTKPIDILLVEDSEADVVLTKEALRESKMLNALYSVEDGVEAMAFLNNEGKYKDVPKPDLILLDLNLPRKDGREVLLEIKKNEKFKHIPVVILTISQSEEDIIKSYNLQANCFIVKPIDLNKFIDVVKRIESFWLSIVQFYPK